MIRLPDKVKEALKTSSVSKNFRIKFPNGEYRDLTNSDILSESVKLTESIISGDTFQYGLCEASVLEFDTINIPNIKGCT